MKTNVGSLDRVIRFIIAIAAAVLIILGVVKGTWAIVIGIVGGIMLVTGILGFCGLYGLFGIRTCPMKAKPKEE